MVKFIIGVIGSDRILSEKSLYIAERIGEDIAKNNCVLICGGRGGVMEAVCKGAKRYNGITVGILPSLEKSEANRFVDIPITTGFGHARNSIVVSSSDAIISISGSVGTLSEIALALCNNKPVILVEGSGGVSDFLLKERKDIDFFDFTDKIYISNEKNAVKMTINILNRMLNKSNTELNK
ncbi:MAG: TIGR00725 family protein [Candidatus Altiarchaeales archaeon]|nr:MAG: TIGR00725 family protein [Candidatus Altiarchaeales archaeon]